MTADLLQLKFNDKIQEIYNNAEHKQKIEFWQKYISKFISIMHIANINSEREISNIVNAFSNNEISKIIADNISDVGCTQCILILTKELKQELLCSILKYAQIDKDKIEMVKKQLELIKAIKLSLKETKKKKDEQCNCSIL